MNIQINSIVRSPYLTLHVSMNGDTLTISGHLVVQDLEPFAYCMWLKINCVSIDRRTSSHLSHSFVQVATRACHRKQNVLSSQSDQLRRPKIQLRMQQGRSGSEGSSHGNQSAYEGEANLLGQGIARALAVQFFLHGYRLSSVLKFVGRHRLRRAPKMQPAIEGMSSHCHNEASTGVVPEIYFERLVDATSGDVPTPATGEILEVVDGGLVVCHSAWSNRGVTKN